MLNLRNIKDGSVFYLINKNDFIVGRKDCDLLISTDQSISRKHAIIRLKENKVTVEDCGSKYNTFYKGEKVEPNVELELNINDVIQFGVINSKYRLEQQTFITTGTRLNNTQKTKLKNELAILKGQYVENWTSECTHLTVDEITLTVKVLHAVIDEKPIVKPTYWSKFVENVAKNLPPPNIDKYNKPPVAEVLLNKIELKNNPGRKTLFKGKLFVFSKEKNKKQMEEIIRKAGGTSISWEKNPMPLGDIINSPKEFIIIQTPNSIDDPNLNDVIKYFSKQGKRTIPLQEIAMSIVLCSCEKDCNPSFNRVEQVFPTTGPIEPTQSNALIPDTQSEYFSVKQYKQEEDEVQLIIPDTFETKLNSPEKPKKEISSLDSRTASNIVYDRESDNQVLKRVNPDEANGNPFKKPKIVKEGTSSEENENDIKKENKDNFLSKTTPPQKRNSEENDPEKMDDSKCDIKKNPFAFVNINKKCKVDMNTSLKSDNPFKSLKRQNSDIPEISDENPFKLSFGKKKRENDDISDLSACKKKKEDSIVKDRIFSSTRLGSNPDNSVSFSKISKISSSDINGAWFSKKSNTALKENLENNFDTEMQNFIDQFKDTVIVEVMAEVPLRPQIIQDNVDGGKFCKHNFKRFVKVKPLRPQKTIIGKDSFITLSPGNTTGIVDSRMELHFSDDEANETLKSKKRPPKIFLI